MDDQPDKDTEVVDKSLAILFDTVEGESPATTAPEIPGMSLTQALEAPASPAAEGQPPAAGAAAPADGAKPKDGGATPPADSAAPAAEPEKTIRRRSKAPTPPPPPAPIEPAAAEKPEVTPPAETKDATADLLDEERERLELARFAASKFPDKYKGLDGKFLKFYKDHKEYLEKARKENPDASLDESDPVYQAWLAKNQPKLTPSEVKMLEREQIIDTADAKSRDEVAKVKEELFRRDEEPKVRRVGDEFYVGLVKEGLPDEVQTALKEGYEKAKELFPVEIDVAERITKVATSDIEEFVRLTRRNPETGRRLRVYDENNEQHKRILGLVNDLCTQFKAGNSPEKIRDGKHFLTREEYFSIKDPSKRAPYWTFSNEEMVRRCRVAAKSAITEGIKLRHQELERMGYVRRAQAAATPQASPPPTPSAPAAPRPAPSAAGTNGPAAEDQPSGMLKIMLGD